MSSDSTPTTTRPGLPPFYRRRRFWRDSFPYVAMVGTFVIGLAVYSVLSNGGTPAARIPLKPLPPTPKTVKLSASETAKLHNIVKEFVMTAVARKHLAESYRLIGPGLKEGISEKNWSRGQVTAVPYPVDRKTTLAFESPDWSYARSVRFQVHVITPDEPRLTAQVGIFDFFVDLAKIHGRWLVNNWVPRWTPPIPNAS